MATAKMTLEQARALVERERVNDADLERAQEVVAAERRRQVAERVQQVQRERQQGELKGYRVALTFIEQTIAGIETARRQAPREFERALRLSGGVPALGPRGMTKLPLQVFVEGLPAAAQALRERMERMQSEKD